MHPVATTPGFIVGSYNRDEADKLFRIFTRDMGMIWSRAQGIRLEKSKLRYHTGDYGLGYFSFVRGKDMWRLTNASSIGDTKNIERISSKARVGQLLRRLVQDEGANPELFDHIKSYVDFINSEKEMNGGELEILEVLITLRILHILGYIGDDEVLNKYTTLSPINKALLIEIKNILPILNRHISSGLKDSHL